DDEGTLVAEQVERVLYLARSRGPVVVGAASALGGWADVAQLLYAPVAVVVGCLVGVGDAAGGLAEQRRRDARAPPRRDDLGVDLGRHGLASVVVVAERDIHAEAAEVFGVLGLVVVAGEDQGVGDST